jgi:hypothetical protein
MPNANAARGLVPVRYRSGQPYNGAASIYYVPASYATALYPGDPVILVTDSSDANGIQTVQRATAAGGAYTIGPMIGVVSAGEPVIAVTRDTPIYHPASTAQYILVADNPDLLFEIQEDSVGGVMTVGAVGRNADFVAGTSSNAIGLSGWQLDSSTLNTTNTLQLRIIAPVQRADNDPTLDYAKWLVSINLHSIRNLTGV